MLSDRVSNPEILYQPLFKNMIAFAWNETRQRQIYLQRTLEQVRKLRQRMQGAVDN